MGCGAAGWGGGGGRVAAVGAVIEARGLKAHPIPGAQRTAIGITGNKGAVEAAAFESMPGVLEVIPVTHAYKLVSREVKPEDSVVKVGDVPVGAGGVVIVGRASGREEPGLPVVTEAIDTESVDLVERYADAIQIGARNMQNFSLLKRAGRARKPVLLKRGLAATLEELLMSAEDILAEGNSQVILCERGVRTF